MPPRKCSKGGGSRTARTTRMATVVPASASRMWLSRVSLVLQGGRRTGCREDPPAVHLFPAGSRWSREPRVLPLQGAGASRPSGDDAHVAVAPRARPQRDYGRRFSRAQVVPEKTQSGGMGRAYAADIAD